MGGLGRFLKANSLKNVYVLYIKFFNQTIKLSFPKLIDFLHKLADQKYFVKSIYMDHTVLKIDRQTEMEL